MVDSRNIFGGERPLTPDKIALGRGMLAILVADPVSNTEENYRRHYPEGRKATYWIGQPSDNEREITGIPEQVSDPKGRDLMITIVHDNPYVERKKGKLEHPTDPATLLRVFDEHGDVVDSFHPPALKQVLQGNYAIIQGALGNRTAPREYDVAPTTTVIISQKDLRKLAVTALKLLANPDKTSDLLDLSPEEYDRQLGIPGSDLSRMIRAIVQHGGFNRDDRELAQIWTAARTSGNAAFHERLHAINEELIPTTVTRGVKKRALRDRAGGNGIDDGREAG